MNAIHALTPFKWNGLWVFNSPQHGLHHEPFVCGADQIINEVLKHKHIQDADNGFLLLFSDSKFPTADMELTLVDEEGGGHVYAWKGTGMLGWLCPALLKFFEVAPEKIFVQIRGIGGERDSN